MHKTTVFLMAALLGFASARPITAGPGIKNPQQSLRQLKPGLVQVKLPDLVPYIYLETPHWPREKQYTLRLTVSNKGEGDVRYNGAADWIIYRVRVGPVTRERKTTSYQLAAGQWYSGGIHLFRIFDLEPGTYTITCRLDPQNFIPESHEDNNTATLQFTIEKPDLICENARFIQDSRGTSLRISLKNIGGPCRAEKNVVIARIFRPDNSFKDVTFLRDDDFTSMSATVTLFDPGTLPPGNYPVRVQVDPTRHYNESNEGNNRKTFTLRVVGRQNQPVYRQF